MVGLSAPAVTGRWFVQNTQILELLCRPEQLPPVYQVDMSHHAWENTGVKTYIALHSDMTGLAARRSSAAAAEKPAGKGNRACVGWGRAEGRGTMRLSLRGCGVRGNVSSS